MQKRGCIDKKIVNYYNILKILYGVTKVQSIIKLSPDDRAECCEVCVFSKPLGGLRELSCSKKGIVSPDYVCKKFSLDIMAKTARRKRSLDVSRLCPKDFEI